MQQSEPMLELREVQPRQESRKQLDSSPGPNTAGTGRFLFWSQSPATYSFPHNCSTIHNIFPLLESTIKSCGALIFCQLVVDV